MEQVTLAFQERTELRKAATRRLRVSGKIPAVVYGQGKAYPISVEAREFSRCFATVGENTVIKLQNGKTVYEVLVKDYQDQILTGNIQHIDFYHVSANKVLHTKVPVHLSGASIGVRNGGLMEQLVHELEVECLAKDIPHGLTIEVATLDVGGSLHIRDIVPPKGVKILGSGDTVVTHVISTHSLNAIPAAETAEVAEAAPAAKASEKKA